MVIAMRKCSSILVMSTGVVLKITCSAHEKAVAIPAVLRDVLRSLAVPAGQPAPAAGHLHRVARRACCAAEPPVCRPNKAFALAAEGELGGQSAAPHHVLEVTHWGGDGGGADRAGDARSAVKAAGRARCGFGATPLVLEPPLVGLEPL